MIHGLRQSLEKVIRRPVAGAGPMALLEPRLERLYGLGEGIWLCGLLVLLAEAWFLPAPILHGDLLGNTVDVPSELIPALDRTFSADLNQLLIHYMPSNHWLVREAYRTFRFFTFIAACGAAIRGRWRFYLLLQLPLLVPPQLFGAVSSATDTALMLALVAGGRCVIKRDNAPLPWIGGAAALVVAWQCCLGGLATQSYFLAMPLSGANDRAVALQNVEFGLTALAPQHPQAVAYVTAQIAYNRHDWARLRQIGPIDGSGFSGTAFKHARLAVLAEARRAAQPGAPKIASPLYATILSQTTFAVFTIGFAMALLIAWVQRRGKRLVRLDTELARLRGSARGRTA